MPPVFALPRLLGVRIAFCAAHLYKHAVLKSEQAVIELPMAVWTQANQIVDVIDLRNWRVVGKVAYSANVANLVVFAITTALAAFWTIISFVDGATMLTNARIRLIVSGCS